MQQKSDPKSNGSVFIDFNGLCVRFQLKRLKHNRCHVEIIPNITIYLNWKLHFPSHGQDLSWWYQEINASQKINIYISHLILISYNTVPQNGENWSCSEEQSTDVNKEQPSQGLTAGSSIFIHFFHGASALIIIVASWGFLHPGVLLLDSIPPLRPTVSNLFRPE